MAEATGAQPDRQQHDKWGVYGPSVGEHLDYLDLCVNGPVEISQRQQQSQRVWRAVVVLEKRFDGEGQPEIKVRFESQYPSPGHDGIFNMDRWISWGKQTKRFAAQGAHSARSFSMGGDSPVFATEAANEESIGNGSKGTRKTRGIMGAVKGFIHFQHDDVTGVNNPQRTVTPPTAGSRKTRTPTFASNAGTPASVSSATGRVTDGGSCAGSELSDEALFRENGKVVAAAATAADGISSTSSTTSASRHPTLKGFVQNFIRGQQDLVSGVVISREHTANSNAGTPPSSTENQAVAPAWATVSRGPGGHDFKAEDAKEVKESRGEGDDEVVNPWGIRDLGFVATNANMQRGRGWNGPAGRELTPHMIDEIQEDEDVGGGFMLTVFRKNKQDAFPLPIKIGVYETKVEATRAAECFSSPVWHEPNANSRCGECDLPFNSVRGRWRHHCRNCGRLVCTHCAGAFWPPSMLPPTYRMDRKDKKVRICSTCFTAGQAFRSALLEGSEEKALAAYKTGCVNLRAPYTIYHNELPLHCAAAGGNVSLLSWLLEDRCCPMFSDKESTIALGDRKRRSVMAAAMGSGQLETMRYLAFTEPSMLESVNDLRTLWEGLDACLRYDEDAGLLKLKILKRVRGNCYQPSESSSGRFREGGNSSLPHNNRSGGDEVSMEEAYTPYYLPGEERTGGGGGSGAASNGFGKSVCIKCFSQKVDCTLVPCGHHCCCLPCAKQFTNCPVCFKKIQQRIKAIDV